MLGSQIQNYIEMHVVADTNWSSHPNGQWACMSTRYYSAVLCSFYCTIVYMLAENADVLSLYAAVLQIMRTTLWIKLTISILLGIVL